MIRRQFDLAVIALASIGLPAACAGGASTDDAQTISDDLGNIPPECRDPLAVFLQDIEPSVERVDWDTATLADVQDVSPVIDQMTLKFQTTMEAAGCDDFAFGADADQQFEFTVEVARQEAPGSERWLQFSRDMSTGLDTTANGLAVDPSALPADRDEATAAVTELISDAGNLNEIPVADLVEITNGIAAVEVVCTPEQAAAFFDTPRLQEFFGAG
jgi:hypothetical protein